MRGGKLMGGRKEGERERVRGREREGDRQREGGVGMCRVIYCSPAELSENDPPT